MTFAVYKQTKKKPNPQLTQANQILYIVLEKLVCYLVH